MISAAKRLAVATLPTPVLHRLRRVYRAFTAEPVPNAPPEARGKPEWEMMPNDDSVWNEPAGWSHQSIADRQKEGWPAFLWGLENGRPIGVPQNIPADQQIDVSVHNAVMIFAFLLGRVRSESERAAPSILDWGGGIGQYAQYAKAFFPKVPWDYHVKEVPELASAGRERNPGITFHSSDDAALARRYDAVFASGSIMYARDLYGLIGRLCDAVDRYLLVTRTPFVEEHDDFVVVQRPYRYGYMTEYAGWFLNRPKLIAFAKARGFELDREFPLAERPYVPNAPEQCRYRGLLLGRVQPR